MSTTHSNCGSPASDAKKCGSCGQPRSTCGCCEITCFERPNYHCGHLLTDADLSLQMKYVVEKNKLRNRALHGHGVACGLKITCDPQCNGHIIVHEGYAIDDCGNDIVVCETRRFDVMAALREKKLLWRDHCYDPCEPKKEDSCHPKQCFYVTICYEEEDRDFETPFQAGCSSGPQQCLPTRTRESFRLDVTDCIPEEKSYIDWIAKRLEHCFCLLRESPVGSLMRKYIKMIQWIVDGKNPVGGDCDSCTLLLTLKGYFLEQLKRCPDELDCNLFREVKKIRCPDSSEEGYLDKISESYKKLFELMLRYQYDCVLSELVLGCGAPEKTCCVVLGTVEVIDGCLVRVCNTPRRYVWSFANLLPLLVNSILTGVLTRRPIDDGPNKHQPHCCPDYRDPDYQVFLREFEANNSARYDAAAAILHAAKNAYGALSDGFDFTNTSAFAPEMFLGMSSKVVEDYACNIGLQSSVEPELPPPALDPFAIFASHTLLRPQDRVKFYAQDGVVNCVRREPAQKQRGEGKSEDKQCPPVPDPTPTTDEGV